MRIALTLIGIILAWVVPGLVQAWQMPLFLLVVATLGMAHGSLDHQVHLSGYGGGSSLLRFYGAYLLAAALVALIWWLSPPAGLMVFMGGSAYHFGQAEIIGPGSRGKGWLRLSRLCWGAALLSTPMLVHAEELSTSLFEWGLPVPMHQLKSAGWVALLASLSGLMLGLWRAGRSASSGMDFRPLGNLLAYGILLVSTPPLWGFCLYFGLWHAWPALSALAVELRLVHLRDWARALLPNYLPSLLASGAWIATAGMRPESYTIAGLLILLSALTVPHTWVFERLYSGDAGVNAQTLPILARRVQRVV
jgi:Brp/Blh family beta-carotene 15,15'-monooxygenase